MRSLRAFTQWRGGYAFAVLAVAVLTVLVLPLRSLTTHAEIALIYVPVIGVVARLSGVRPSMLASMLAFLAIGIVFVSPGGNLIGTSARDWLTLITFLVAAVLLGTQTGVLRARETAALRRQRELAMLNTLSSRLLSEESPPQMAGEIAREVVSVLGASRSSVRTSDDAGKSVLLAEAGEPSGGLAEDALAAWVLSNDKAVGLPSVPGLAMGERPMSVGAADAVQGAVADGVYLPLYAAHQVEGVLYARPVHGTPRFDDDQLRMLVAIANLASSYLERNRLQRAAALVAAERQTDRLKGTLVSSVSHELKTPLASITATVTGLLDEDVETDPERVRDELRAVEQDLDRLHASIGDLLDLSRLESDSWATRPDTWDVREILGTVASKLPPAERARIRFELPDELPPIRVDFAQWARMLQNLVENALAYSGPDAPVTVSARALSEDLLVWVDDEGPGVPGSEKEHVFDKFYRGSASEAVPSGTGLGLAIAREIVRTHGGRIWVEDAGKRGARFLISVPAVREEGA